MRKKIVDKYGFPNQKHMMSYPFHMFALSGNMGELINYVSQGADVNCRDKQGRTPLHEACCTSSEDKVDVIRYLVKSGASVIARDSLGDTPLHCVARHRRNRFAASFLVIDCKAPLTWINDFGQTPLDVAKEVSSSVLAKLDIKPEKLTEKSKHFESLPQVLQFLVIQQNLFLKSLREISKEKILLQLLPYENEKLYRLPLPNHLKCYLGGTPYIEWFKQQDQARGGEADTRTQPDTCNIS